LHLISCFWVSIDNEKKMDEHALDTNEESLSVNTEGVFTADVVGHCRELGQCLDRNRITSIKFPEKESPKVDFFLTILMICGNLTMDAPTITPYPSILTIVCIS
jgi:hypothetical protein